jgi:hypothetical protein
MATRETLIRHVLDVAVNRLNAFADSETSVPSVAKFCWPKTVLEFSPELY